MTSRHTLDNTTEPWRVGVLFSRTGCMALIEETQYRGTMLAINEINDAGGVNGRALEPVVCDPASDNMLFRAHARRLLAEENISTIFGCYTSSSRKAVLPIIERLNGLLWYPTLYEGFEYSPNIIYTGSAPNQNSVALCNYLVGTYGNRFYFVGSDYVYPRESNRLMRTLVEEAGGTVAGEMYVSLNARREEFYPIMRDIKKAQPDVIFSTVVGDATVFLYQAYADFNLDARTTPIASLTTTETEIGAMGHDVGLGHITAAPYFDGVGGDCGRAFSGRYRRSYGDSERTNMCVEASYFQVKLFASALAQVNSLDPDLMRPVVLGTTVEAPQGNVSINPSCSHANLWSRIGRCGEDGRFDIVYESLGEVTADPFMLDRPKSV
ncbi:MAG: transporter substrate-binding domain-containing protein [Alphaproteobacteria bacterium]|nr:transporter substrate-binding domain-containing protein [Alphaproteobacteria bacterium]